MLYTPYQVVYSPYHMRRVQIYIEEDVDEALAAQAGKAGISKAALIRDLIGRALGGGGARDALNEIIGAFDYPTGDIDDVVYRS